LEKLPVFVRAGTILPRQPLVQSTSERPAGPLRLDVYPGDDCTGTIYLDDGHSMDFEKGNFLRQTIRCIDRGGSLTITFAPREGRFDPWWKEIEIIVHDRPGRSGVYSPALPVRRVHGSGTRNVDFYIPDVPSSATIRIDS
jgi:alpha-glucosidase